MRKFFLGIILGVSLVLGGCADNPFLARPVTPELTVQQKAQATIDNANAVLAAVAQSVVSAYKEGSISPAQMESLRIKLNDAADALDRAQELLSVGDVTGANDKAKIVAAVLNVVKSELIKYKKENTNG